MNEPLSNDELLPPPQNGSLYTFEECHKVIEKEIEKRREPWELKKAKKNIVSYEDFDDVAQIMQLHIFNKWHRWDQTQSLSRWLNLIISTQYYALLARDKVEAKFKGV
jgi:hypothetical protein